jgi:hypothetical protein
VKQQSPGNTNLQFLSWINDGLRKQVEVQEQIEQETHWMHHLKAYLIAIVAGIVLVVLKLFDI